MNGITIHIVSELRDAMVAQHLRRLKLAGRSHPAGQATATASRAVGPGPRLYRRTDMITDELRAAVIASGVTQAELSRRSGVPQSQISTWLAGRCLPSGQSIDRLADAMGLVLRPKKFQKNNRKTD